MPDKDEFNPAHNPDEDRYERLVSHYNNSVRSNFKSLDSRLDKQALKDLQRREGDVDKNNSISRSDGGQNSLQKKEEQGDNNWQNNTTSAMSPSQETSRFNMKGISGFRKIGLLISMIGLTFTIIGIIGSLVMGALGLVNLKETSINKLSKRGDSIMQRVENKIFLKRFSHDLTKGCSVVKIKCRYRGFSEREIKKFNRRAAEYGWKMESTSNSSIPPFRNRVVLQQVDSDGKVTKTIDARNFNRELNRNPILRKAVSKFYVGKVELYAGKAAKGVWVRTKTFLGKRATPKGSGSSEEERQKTSLRELVRTNASGEAATFNTRNLPVGATPEETTGNDRANNASGAAKEVIDDESARLANDKNDFSKDMHDGKPGSDEYVDKNRSSVDKIESAGSGISGAASVLGGLQNLCMLKVLLSVANESRAINQSIQLIRFAVMYASVADRIKSGHADGDTSNQINSLMSLMTNKGPRGFTGFDSMGWGWVSTNAVHKNEGEDVGRFQNGGPPPGVLGETLTEILNYEVLNIGCKVALSKEAMVVSIGFTAAGIFTGGLATHAQRIAFRAAENAAETAVEKTIQKELADVALKNYLKNTTRSIARGGAMTALFQLSVPPLVSTAARSATNTVVTGDEKDEEPMNAYISGLGAATSQTQKAQGMEPASINDIIQQDKLAYSEQLTIAKQDGINQFDIYNEFSFANKFSSLLAPNTARLSSISSIPSFIASFNFNSIKVTGNAAYAANKDDAQYKYCIDDTLKKLDIAGDPFCNPQYGMDFGVLDSDEYDPEVVIDYLYSNGLISDDGSPQGAFSEFIEACINTNSPIGDEDYCAEKARQDFTMMRMYCLHTSVDNDMNDGEGVGCAPDVTVNESEEESSGTIGTPETIDENTLYEPSHNIQCGKGTKDLGVVNDAYHAGQKFKARLCAVENVPETGDLSDVPGANGKLVVNARISGVVAKMVQDAKTAGLKGISAAEGYRSMKRQKYLYSCGCTGGNPVAQPGNSNHQAGVAIDWDEPMRAWLISNGERYGFKWYGPGDQPHFSPNGR